MFSGVLATFQNLFLRNLATTYPALPFLRMMNIFVFATLEVFAHYSFAKISSPKQLVRVVEQKQYLAGQYFFCPEIQILRLKLFSYLYTEEFEQLTALINAYPKALQDSTFLTKAVRDNYLREVQLIQCLVQEGVQESHKFCAKTIEDTIGKCFR